MFGLLCLLVAVSLSQAAPPPLPRPYLPQHGVSQQLRNYGLLDYLNPEVTQYYNDMVEEQLHQRQSERQVQSEAPSRQQQAERLENLENPDSEVELLPGAQQPQQPPQQVPVNPNLPGGLVPGQRVFIVHMPVPGYRPGTLGGYQPVYIVAAAPQGNPQAAQGNPQYLNNGQQYPNNGYQNAILLSPQGQVVSPFFGYPGGYGGLGGLPGQQAGLLVGAPLIRGAEGYNQFGYQQPQAPQGLQGGQNPQNYQIPAVLQGLQGPAGPQGYGPAGPQGYGVPQGDFRGPVQFSQLLSLQGQPRLQGQQLQFQGQPQPGQFINLQGQPVNSARNVAVNEAATNTESKRVGVSDEGSKESQRHNARPTPAHAQLNRTKA